jgi:hypothetical protein
MNVLAFGAKGDCSTDDHNAIMAAQTAAIALAVNNSNPGVVYFPKPPGGCYLTSTLQWAGAPLIGQPSGQGVNSPHQYGVTIKGLPGQDILAPPDPAVSSGYTWYTSWTIRDLAFLVDASVTVGTAPNIHPHRWPGRWFDDGAMTAGSTTFATSFGTIGCSDIGQGVIVNGAGPTVTTTSLAAAITSTTAKTIQISGVTSGSWPTISGYLKIDSEIVMYVGTQTNGISAITVMRGQAGTTAATHSAGATVTVMGNLTTTIASVDPCWAISANSTAWKVVKLGAAASTTVSNAHSYISILDLPVATNIGNCAIAFDNFDALNTDWPNPSGVTTGIMYSHMENVTFETNYGATAAANSCGMFSQGSWISYGFTADRMTFGMQYGVVQGNAEVNSWWGGYGDYQDWNHLDFVTNYYPWISYNGGEGHMANVEITAFAGPQFMSLGNAYADAGSWNLNIQEMETWSQPNDTRFGLRIAGGIGYTLNGSETNISADPNNHAWIDTTALTCYGCFADAGGTNLYGAGNTIQKASGASVVNDLGRANTATNWYSATWASGVPNPTTSVAIPQKGVPNLNGGSEPDFVADGYPATPYRHEDMFIWPKDFIVFNSGGTLPWSGYWYTGDTNSLSGGELFIHTGSMMTGFFTATATNPTNPGYYTIGTNFPAAKGTAYFSLLCPTATTTTIGITSSDGTGNFGQTISCSTTLRTYSFPFDFTTHTGNIAIGNLSITAGQDFKLAWAYIAFAPQLPAGTTIGGLAPAVQLGPTSGTASGDLACFTNTTGSFNDCNTLNTFQLASAAAMHLTIKSTGSHAYMTLNPFTNATVGAVEYIVGSTNMWRAGIQGDGTNNYEIKDSVNGRAVFNLPNNTMPANSLGGNANGATAITQSSGDNSTNIATDAFVRSNLPLSGTTGNIGGSSLATGACTSGTVNITGATTSMAVVASPATYPGDGMMWRPYVSSAGVVTVKVCASVAGTPTASAYNVRVVQ